MKLTSQAAYQTMELFLVENDPDFIQIAQNVFKNSVTEINLHILDHVDDVINFVKKNEVSSCTRRPDLILLNLDVAGKNGHKIISEIKQNEMLKRVPLIVFTNAHSDEDIYEIYSNYANCCIKKPNDENEFISVLEIIKTFWLTIVKLPSE